MNVNYVPMSLCGKKITVMKKLLTLIAFICFCANAKAQYVNIPDSNFRYQLMFNYSTCFDSLGRLDTSCNLLSNQTYLSISYRNIENLDGIQYFKNLIELDISGNNLTFIPKISDSIIKFVCSYNQKPLSYITNFPLKARTIWISRDSLDSIPVLPNKVEQIICSYNQLKSLPNIPDSLKTFDCSANKLLSLPTLNNKLTSLNCSYNLLSILPTLPANLGYLTCSNNSLTALPTLPNNLKNLDFSFNKIQTVSVFPNSITKIDCSFNLLQNLPILPVSLTELTCNYNPNLYSLPPMPINLYRLTCRNNDSLSIVPSFTNSMRYINLSFNNITQLPQLPIALTELNCYHNKISNLPQLPNSIRTLNCGFNLLNSLPKLPDTLATLVCRGNYLSEIPRIPNSLTNLVCIENPNLFCLPKLPSTISSLMFDPTKIFCLPLNSTNSLITTPSTSLYHFPICNPTNNINNCASYPTIKGNVFYDNNNNGIKDINDFGIRNIKVQLSSTSFAFTDILGNYNIASDTIGIGSLNIISPLYTIATPSNFSYDARVYDTIIIKNIPIHSIVIKDSLSINIIPINFAARPGFKYVYKCEFENVGTTTLNPTINFNYDSSVLVVDSTNNATITNIGNALNLAVNNFVPGQANSFYVYTTVKPTATLGNMLQATARITGGNANAADTANTTIRGSYDPNDKQATPKLSVTEVADNAHWINYTVRFQNTGNDTAFTVVVADTLNVSKLQTNTLQLTGTSHDVKATQNDNIVYFEFLNINLPDSNKNKTASNGFVSFRVKPITTLTNGNVVPNKASIYFDYNSPILTNTANTIIGTLPLTLTAFGAIPKEEQNKIFIYWNTANEVNTSYFIIEQSTDARNFTPSAEVAAIGKGNNSYYYNIAKNNVQYVRLKMVDKNGTFSHSNIIRITTNDKQQTITVASPAKNELKINVTSTTLNNTKACLINGQGKVVKTFNLKQGYQTIDIAALQSGLYYLQTNEVVKKVMISD